MQRRATAISVAFFLVLAVGAYALIGMAEEPAVSIEEQNREIVVGSGESFTVDGVTYTVGEVGEGSTEAVWRNESARFTATLENNSTVAYRDANYTVLVPNVSDPGSFTLREVQPVDRPTVTQNGTVYVIVEEEGERRLVPRSEYLPEPDVREFEAGDELDYGGNATTVAAITPEEATLEWFGPADVTVSISEGENASLQGTPYLAHFPGDGTVVLTTAYEDYAGDLERQSYFHERVNGLWGVTILSSLAVVLLVGMALLPSRY